MTSRVVLVHAKPDLPCRPREECRDGWRLFRSSEIDFEIAIPRYQTARIETIAERERSEWYALVVGELLRDDQGVHAVARDFVPNEWAERGRAHVHVGAAAEARVRDLACELHPTLHPLGNTHTHSHFTTRPSATDREEFWNDPYSVSIIVDPFDRPSIAVYRGREGERLSEIEEDPVKSSRPRALSTSPGAVAVPQALLGVRPVRALAVGLDRRLRLGMAVFSVVVVGSFGVLGHINAARVAEIARSNEDLRERLSALEARPARAEPTPRSLDDSILACVAPER